MNIKLNLILLLVLFLVMGCEVEPNNEAEEPKEMSTIESIATHYGVEHWENVKRLGYTFVVTTPDRAYERKWEWFPQKDSIVFHTDSIVSYTRSSLDTSDEAMVYIDKRFINDSYWLLFPLQIYWSEVDTDESKGESTPISGTEATKVVIRFGDKGYTPNDVYEIFINEEYQILEWIFKRGGSDENPSAITWEGHERFGPILISTIHKTPDGSPRITFKDVEVEME